MKLRITHKTLYSYDAPVNYGLQQIRLTPQSDPHQTVNSWSLSIEGGAEELSYQDQYGNACTLVQVTEGAREVVLTVAGEVETHSSNGIYGQIYGIAPLWHFLQDTPATEAGKGIAGLSRMISGSGDTLGEIHALSHAILKAVPYTHGVTNVDSTAEQALAAGGGVCQDHAQILIAALRHAGVPARYVSGYLLLDDRVDQDASHAWAEAHLDGLGWVAFDVSNGISPDERYVRLAAGRCARDAAPISGMRMGPSAETLEVSLEVQQQSQSSP